MSGATVKREEADEESNIRESCDKLHSLLACENLFLM